MREIPRWLRFMNIALLAIIVIGGGHVMAKDINLLVLGQYEGRYETIMINTYNSHTHDTQILSIPPGAVFVDGAEILRHDRLHLTLEEQGLQSVQKALGDYLGLEIPYYLIVDYAGAQGVVDAMDGVIFELPYAIQLPATVEEPAVNLPAGVQTFDGNTARRFLRYRTADLNGPAELQVIRLQQLFLDAMIRQLAQQKWKLIPVAFKLPKMIKTNVGVFKILDIAYGAMDLTPDNLNVKYDIISGEFVQIKDGYQYQIQELQGYMNKEE